MRNRAIVAGFALAGGLRKYRAIEAAAVASAMVGAARAGRPGRHVYHYDEMLALAAEGSEDLVDAVLRRLIASGTIINYDRVLEEYKNSGSEPTDPVSLVSPPRIELGNYDALLSAQQEVNNAWI